MKRQLTPQEIIYKEDFTNVIAKDEKIILEYLDVCQTIEEALNIKKEGFNVYLVDSFSKEKLEKIMSHINSVLSKRESPKDICYVTVDDVRAPEALFLSNGIGEVLRERLEDIKDFYYDKVFLFYNSSINKEKEDIINDVQKKRSDYIGGLIKSAKEEGFDLKATSSGFAFIPLVDGEAMTEDEYDDLEEDYKGDISVKAGKLKEGAEGILEELKDIEINSIEKLKNILSIYIKEESKALKNEIIEEFGEEEEALEYLQRICSNVERELIDNYSMSFEDDEDKITEIISKYVINVLVNNKDYDHPRVIFEEDPSMNNLIGTIEYENHNGVYTTDVSLIKPGSLLAANEGCLILRLSSLLTNGGVYYYLVRALLNKKITYDFNRGYLELLSLNGLKPESIPIDTKVILIGDYESFDLLYNYDEDFRNIFRVRSEFNPYIEIDNFSKCALTRIVNEIISKNEILGVSPNGINEIGKYLSRKASDRQKIFWDVSEIERVLLLADRLALQKGKIEIDNRDICETIYKGPNIEKEYLNMYKSKKMLIDVKNRLVGSINGLSVIDLGYLSFGKPLRISCVCLKGAGRIIDSQRESNLSGSIHNKSISILRGFLNKFLSAYESIPVDFHLSFEQVYGKVEGDSASVAEIVAMISALSKIPINQNIAVTGSINQFGEIQPIGGVNDKIEGFFNVCKTVDSVKGKGVLIPESNMDELILNPEVEEAVANGDFSIYTMNDINDAIMTLLLDDKITFEDVAINIHRELARYNKR